ncbi:MAG TPA: class I SAM-dependent methyltransferase [Acidimicrobiales bacterium]|nr:class I SAM-dependent methyltransferase [Acidimicrobiales bacterium]
MPLPVIRWLERHRRPDWRVLELGGGMSTVWWSTRAAEVVTLEDNAEWAQRLADRLGDSPTVTLLVLPREEWWAWLAEERAFDLVYVDAADAPPDFTRVKLLEAAHHLVAPGGWLALDDSDRPRYGGADAVVGWPATQVGGLKGTPFAVTETTFYHRPA